MIIGLLEAESLPDKVTSLFGSYGDMFVALLSPFHPSFTFKHYAVDKNRLPLNIDECDGYIITGSRHNAYDNDPWIINLREFIQKIHCSQKKCLGVCFGHQVIAQALGGITEKSDKGWGVGASNFSIKNHPPWISTSVTDFNILVSHQDQVIRLPDDGVRFATNEFCPNGGFCIGRHIFTLQGHPEFTKTYLNFLIEKRKKILGDDITQNALNSISSSSIHFGFSTWINDFFNNFSHAY